MEKVKPKLKTPISWKIVEIERTISSSRTNRKKKPEWIVMNY